MKSRRESYELIATLFAQAQDTYARASEMNKMPLNPIVVHGPAQLPRTHYVPAWRTLAIRAARDDGWILLLGGLAGAVLGRYWPSRRLRDDGWARPTSSPNETPPPSEHPPPSPGQR
jgi:hypothetical protein